jgi:hypothetical protein
VAGVFCSVICVVLPFAYYIHSVLKIQREGQLDHQALNEILLQRGGKLTENLKKPHN